MIDVTIFAKHLKEIIKDFQGELEQIENMKPCSDYKRERASDLSGRLIQTRRVIGIIEDDEIDIIYWELADLTSKAIAQING